MAPVSKAKKAKAKGAQKVSVKAPAGNMFDLLEGKTGNPSTPQEFDDSHPEEGELYFKASDEADAPAIKRVKILNFIHQDLHHDTERKIPALTGEESERDVEIYHRATFLGQEFDVCVHFGVRDESGHKTCVALVKLAADNMEDETQFVFADASWNADAKTDKFGGKHEKLEKSYWAPRWKYLVNILRGEMAERYSIEGVYSPPPKSGAESDDDDEGVSSSGEVIEEEVEVFAGCTGKIIGPKGSEINKIKSESGCTNIQIPERAAEGAERPKARSKVIIKVTGTAKANSKAKKMLIAVQDEWADAPRPDRNAGGGGGGDFHGKGGFHGDAGAGTDFGGSRGVDKFGDSSIPAADLENGDGDNGGGEGEWAAPAAAPEVTPSGDQW